MSVPFLKHLASSTSSNYTVVSVAVVLVVILLLLHVPVTKRNSLYTVQINKKVGDLCLLQCMVAVRLSYLLLIT